MAWAWLAPALWLGLALASGVHELGHALAARLAGARVVDLRLGSGPGALRGQWRGVAWSAHLLFPVGGACRSEGALRRGQQLLERAGGSLANLAAGALLLLLWPWLAGLLGWCLLVTQLAVGLGQLLPLGDLDGAAVLRLLRQREPEQAP